MDLLEALYTTRAMRRVKPDPISDEAVAAMLDAAIRGPSGGNTQNWRFLTVTDPDTKQALGELYREAFDLMEKNIYGKAWERAERHGDKATLRIVSSSKWLADNFEQVPLWVMAFSRNDPSGASIYPAVWNMMLAARGLGIGTCLTTILGIFKSDEVFDVLEVPENKGWGLAAAVSAGYPLGRWGLARRKPVHPFTYAERWGEPVTWTMDEPAWREPENYDS